MQTLKNKETYGQVERFLNRYANWERTGRFGREVKLDRMHRLLDACGNPHRAGYGCILVAGSKGKGSIATMIHSILAAQGVPAGLYTSPHVVSWSERIRTSKGSIPLERALELTGCLEDILRRSPSLQEQEPSYFELTTALALMYFAGEGVDTAVLEVGLGGRWDATNASDAVVSVIGRIGYEHQNILGDRLADIAREKCGIIKEGGHVVAAHQDDAVKAVIRQVCRDRGAQVAFTDETIRIREREANRWGQTLDLEGSSGKEAMLCLPLLGSHQAENAACAYQAVTTYSALRGQPLTHDAIRRGFAQTSLRGRLEIVRESPWVVLDGSHNPDSARALASALRRHLHFRDLHIVFGMLKDKDPVGTLTPFRSWASHVWLTPVASERSYDVGTLAEKLRAASFSPEPCGSLGEALSRARAGAHPEDLVLVMGSLYLAGEACAEISS